MISAFDCNVRTNQAQTSVSKPVLLIDNLIDHKGYTGGYLIISYVIIINFSYPFDKHNFLNTLCSHLRCVSTQLALSSTTYRTRRISFPTFPTQPQPKANMPQCAGIRIILNIYLCAFTPHLVSVHISMFNVHQTQPKTQQNP